MTSGGPADTALRGDLHERPDGGFDGWCWAPGRPDERLVVDLLVNDTPALSMVAALFRRDLLALGCGDGRHGFSLRLPPHLLPAAEESLVTARERRSGVVFGRVLRTGDQLAPPGLTRVDALAGQVAGLWQDLAACTPSPLAAQVRGLFGELARRCAARARGASELDAGRPACVLPAVADPALTVILCAGTAPATRRRIAALAPALAAAAAELLVADAGADPACAVLPAVIRNLRYLRDPAARDPGAALRLAAQVGRGRTLLLLDPAPAPPSAAALLALARSLAAAPSALLLAAPAARLAARLVPALADAARARVPAPLGALIGGPRGLWSTLGALPPALAGDRLLAGADLALRAHLRGVPWLVLEEPPIRAAAPESGSESGPGPGPVAALLAARQMHARWSFAA